MYEQYWGLQAKPFDNAVDDRFFFPAESHEGALLKLRYAIENRRGAALLTGAAGLGKTLLVNRLFSLLDDAINPRVHVVFPKMETLQLMNFLGSMIAGDAVGTQGLDQSIQVLQNFLAHNSSEGYHTVVAIDEAHLLNDSDTFESLRLLLNFQSTGQYDLSLLFVGQPRIINTLQRVNGMDDRVAVKCLLRTLCATKPKPTSNIVWMVHTRLARSWPTMPSMKSINKQWAFPAASIDCVTWLC